MTPVHDRVVVVGASASGLGIVEELRRHGYPGRVDLVGEEEHLPYDRPPLSKQLLTGLWQADRLALTSAERLADLNVTVHLGHPAVGVDAAARTVLLAGGEVVAADAIAIATGCLARTLPGTEQLSGVHTLRTLADAQGLRAGLGDGRRLVVVGSGFLGMEVAAVARGLGTDVTVVAPEEPMIRAVGPAVSRSISGVHADQGVHLLIGSGVAQVLSADGKATGVLLDDGRELPADAVVVAIGAVPATGWLADSGLTIADGVVCDATLQAAPGIFAAGDVARWRDPRTDELVRVEHRMHATDSAAIVAANILAPGPDEMVQYTPLPFWWSDQFTARIQAYGWPSEQGYLWQGDLAERKAVVLYADGERLTGALGLNSAKQLRAARELVLAGTPLSDAGEVRLLN